MKCTPSFAAVALTLLASANALAVWGVRYEVNDGNGWTSSLNLNLSRDSQSIDFRIIVYHDGATTVQTSVGNRTAIGPQRLCNSQKISNFGAAGLGDSLISFGRTVPDGNTAALEVTQVGSDKVLGRPNAAVSFSADLDYAFTLPHVPKAELQFYQGTFVIGNAAPASRERTITLTANTFSYPNATIMNGGAYGAAFLYTIDTPVYGVAIEPATVIPAVITIHTPHCAQDLNDDGFVLDDDVPIFSAAFNILECADPAMPPGCPADLNLDGFVDDDDFAIFAAAYDSVFCP